MSGKMFNPFRFCAIVVLLVSSCGRVALAQPGGGEKTLQRTADPVIVPGTDLFRLAGRDIDRLRVFAFHDGKAEAIPFQIDQRDSNGDWVWDVIYRKRPRSNEEGFYCPTIWDPSASGPGTLDDEDPPERAVFDENDLLLVMAKDLGDRSELPTSIPGAVLIMELEVTDSLRGKRGWAYVAYFEFTPPAMSGVRYMRYAREEKKVQSPLYEFRVSDEHPALVTDLYVNDYRIVDKIWLRGKITLTVPLPARQISFTEDDIHGYTQGYIAGPIRIIKRNIAHLSLAGGLVATADVICDHFYYPLHAEIPVCLSIRFPVKEVAMALTTDYRDPPFHRLYMGEAVEGVQGAHSGRSLPVRTDQVGTEWMALDSHEASLVSVLVVPDALEGYADTRPCLCRGQEQPARIRTESGVQTEAGFLITTSAECPKGEHVVYGTYLISGHPYESGDEDAVLELQYNKLKTRVSLVSQARQP